MSELTLKTPVAATTDASKLEYAYIAQETLRLEHNKKGAEYRDGKITKSEWETWLKDYFNPRSLAIVNSINSCKSSLKQSTTYSCSLENDFQTKA